MLFYDSHLLQIQAVGIIRSIDKNIEINIFSFCTYNNNLWTPIL